MVARLRGLRLDPPARYADDSLMPTQEKIASTQKMAPSPANRLQASFRSGSNAGLTRTLDLLIDGKPAATATWVWIGPGAAQLLSIEVVAPLRRRGHGSTLFKQILDHARQEGQTRNQPLRRFIALAGQKSHLHARAWFTRMGFHHVSTVLNVLLDEEVMVYALGLD